MPSRPVHGTTERLAISEHTVKSHVGNILAKLQLADRTQAAVYAWRQSIVRRECPCYLVGAGHRFGEVMAGG